jgi:hypothetical protein
MLIVSNLSSKSIGGDRGNIPHRERDDRDRDRRNSGGSGLGTPFISSLFFYSILDSIH